MRSSSISGIGLPALDRARRSLVGLTVGDAFGQQLFGATQQRLEQRELPAGPWSITDDSEMALALLATLEEYAYLDPDDFARRLARRYTRDPNRGYGNAAARLLAGVARGEDWRVLAPSLFQGEGSAGNGAAMRVAPLGAWFADDLKRVVDEAVRSARVTHVHAEGIDGAVAVALAAALACDPDVPLRDVCALVAERLPHRKLRAAVEHAAELGAVPVWRAAGELGTGQGVLALDTVPFALWAVSQAHASYEDALWCTARGLGDVDTTCAIVGGIVGCRLAPPADWVTLRGPLTVEG